MRPLRPRKKAPVERILRVLFLRAQLKGDYAAFLLSLFTAGALAAGF